MDLLSTLSIRVSIQKTNKPEDLQWCAHLMASNEPWITLKRNYEDGIKLLQDPISEVYLLKNNQDPIGFIMIKMKGSFTGYIQVIAISQAFRGKGIGEAAIKYIEELIFQSFPNVFICASSFNTGAQKLYQKLGYETVGILKDYIIKGYDEVFMRKTRGPIDDFKK
jgi:ribosomal protein S18 acetylase RimI-like enzyme